MNNADNPYLLAVFKNYGPPWDPTVLAEQDGEESASAFAVDLGRYAASILANKNLLGRCPNLTTEFFFVENSDVNGFAGKISDHSEHYVVGIYAGTVIELFNIFFRKEYLSSLRQGLKSLAARSDWELQRYSLYFSSLFLVFHEFGHVFRGHINYSAAKGYNSIPWMENQSQPSVDSPEFTERRHLSECDADATAGMLLAGEIQIHSRNIGQQFQVDISSLREEFTVLAATAIHFLFCKFDDQCKSFHPYYPPPHVRSAIVHAHVATQLVSEGLDPTSTMFQVLQGLIRAETIRREMGLRKGNYELATAFESWQANYRDRLSELTKALAPFSPCNR
jgi:hypothetical protein